MKLGIHKLLEACFWPKYKVPVGAVRFCERLSLPSDGQQRRWQGGIRGFQRGTIVDNEISAWCRRVTGTETSAAKSGWIANKKAFHPYTVRLIRAFQMWNWEPVATQVALSYPAWGLHTRADLIVRHRVTGHLILLEIKTGSSGYFTMDNGQRFNAPLRHVTSTPLHHALAQLKVTCILSQLNRDRLEYTDALVVVVNDAELTSYPMLPWCTEFGATVIDVLESRRIWWAEQQRNRASGVHGNCM